MTVDARLELIALDAADIETLAAFYTALTGGEIIRSDDDWIAMRLTDGQELAFQLAPDHLPPQWPGQDLPQQMHLDLLIDDCQAAAARAIELGARHLADGASWITLADPAGHPFDLCQRDGVGPSMQLHAVTIDAGESASLAHFYADLLGLEVGYEGPEGALVAGGATTIMVQQIEGYRAPDWPDPSRPQQAHLDILVNDLDDGQEHAIEVGAVLLSSSNAGFRVFADPSGHPFCLVD